MTGRAFDTWFLALADPAPGAPSPPCPASFDAQGLVELADHHGVLPAVARSLRRLEAPAPAVRSALALAQERLFRGVAFSLRLRKQLEPIAAAIAEAGGALARLGYRRAAEPPSKYPGQYAEEIWLLDDPGTGAVELHWDLVNSPLLRRRCSVGFHDLAAGTARPGALPRATPASLLVVAAVHAAMSHRFDRLQPLADVCQAARGAAGPVDTAWLAEAARRTGAAFALATALRLAAALFRERACSALVDGTPCLSAAGRLAHRILTPHAVLHPKSLAAKARRQLYRELLKRR